MRNDELILRLKGQLQHCAGFDGDELAADRKRALDYYFQRPNGTEVPGRATVVSGDVSAVTEATLATMLEAFGNDSIVEIPAHGPEDEEQAQLEADVITHFVMQDGKRQLAEAIKDALLLRNGWIKVWVQEDRRSKIEEYRDVSPEALVELTNRPGIECDVVAYDAEDGYLKLRCKYLNRRFRAEAVPVENIFYPKNYDGVDFQAIQDIPFIAERHVEPRYELVKRGFSKEKVMALPQCRSDANTAAYARNPRQQTERSPGVDAMAELVEWFEAYTMLDGEREVVCFAQNEILKRQPARLVPYAAGVVLIAPHRLTGISLWDKTRQTQDVNTALQRGLLDNVAATSKNRLAYLDGKTNPDDVADGRVNGAIRVKNSVARVSDAVMPFAVPDTSSGIMAAIQHQRGIRTELAGASLDLQAAEMQLNRQVGSQGVDRMYSAAEALAAHMTRNIADTLIRSTFLLAHATLRETYDEPVHIKQLGNWQTAIPSEWPERTRLTVKVGMSAGERSRRQAALDKLLQSQINLAQLGMDKVLVDLDGFYSLLMDWARVSDVPSPERYFIDPRTERSQAALESKEKSQAEQQKMQAQLVQQAVDLEKLRTAFDKYKTDAELQFKYFDATLKSEVEEAKIAGTATTELLKSQDAGKAQANGSTNPTTKRESVEK